MGHENTTEKYRITQVWYSQMHINVLFNWLWYHRYPDLESIHGVGEYATAFTDPCKITPQHRYSMTGFLALAPGKNTLILYHTYLHTSHQHFR